jgi:hypothetical protein
MAEARDVQPARPSPATAWTGEGQGTKGRYTVSQRSPCTRKFYCTPHAEGAEDAENRRGLFSASSISPRLHVRAVVESPNAR